jgi:hypothetical protein
MPSPWELKRTSRYDFVKSKNKINKVNKRIQ